MNRFNVFIVAVVLLFAADSIFAQTLLHYWNFNNNTNVNTLLEPNSLIAGASISHIAGGISAIDVAGGTGQNFNVENLNARNGDVSGTHLRFNDPIGGALVFAMPTTGYKDIVINYATRRSSSGAGHQIVEYTTDGTNYTYLATILPNNGNPTLITLDFTSITQVNNNANFKIRYTFEQGPGGTVGNNRFDNYTIEGNSISGEDLNPPTVVFSPLNNSIDIAINVNPTITFNEDVRFVDNTEITNNNAKDAIIFKLNNANGTDVAFSATYSNRVLTVVPNSNLMNNQTYFLSLKSNTIEDMNDNAIENPSTTNFSTIAVQTQFNAGDIIPIAYRMNSTATDDEIALLTLVNILPGTKINITDAKYTDNAQPQCTGGITWTAPQSGVAAGTVITIKNDAGTANIGTITGSTFGLSSSGDQFILYTGIASNPNYITALSSNMWLANNTSCSGSLSKLPMGLVDGVSSISTSTSPGNSSGNTVNAYYNGPQDLSYNLLKTQVLNPANWIGVGSGTPAQVWPTWSFQGPPTVVSANIVNQQTIRISFNKDLDPVSSVALSNYTGIAGLSSISRSNNGTLKDTITLHFSVPFNRGENYSLVVSNVKDAQNVPMFTPYTFNFSYNTTISFDKVFDVMEEYCGIYNLVLKLQNPSNSSVRLVLKPSPFSNIQAGDITFINQTLNFTGNSETTQIIQIPVYDDLTAENDEYFVVELIDASGLAITGTNYATLYIKDNDKQLIAPANELSLNYLTSFSPSQEEGRTTEIVAYDANSKRLFMTSAIQGKLDIANFSNPLAITPIKSIDMNPYGGITSVAVRNGLVAVASPNADETLNGSVVFFDIDGNYIKSLTVGALPDMLTFTPDGKKIMTANEGQPNDAYTIDPEGSVSIIDISKGIANTTQQDAVTLLFTQFNSNETELINSGVRKLKKTSTLSQDFEPEYVSVSHDSKKAWVILQENNAFAEINLVDNTITSVWALGTKDWMANGNGLDASDNNQKVLISSWPIKSFYIPDGTANFNLNGTNYLVTANEGDEKEYGGLNERTTVGASTYKLDPQVYPHSAMLKQSYNLGRLRVTNLNGDENGDGFFEQIYTNGTRSFSIWNADSKSIVWDSKDEFEQITSKHPIFKNLFNADNEGSPVLKSRSRAKGPEPEGLAVAEIGGKRYAFVGLERIGGVMAYNITNPNSPYFIDYYNSRIETNNSDLGPEAVIFIGAEQSPDGLNYLLIANEISGTISVYNILTAPEVNLADKVSCKNTPVELANIVDGINLSVINGSGNYTYNWTPTTGLNLSNPSNPILTNPTASRSFTLNVTDNQTGLMASGKVYVKINSEPIFNLNSNTNFPKNTQLNLNSLVTNVKAEGAYQINWFNSSMELLANSIVVPANGMNIYYAKMTDANGCVSATKRAVIYVKTMKDGNDFAISEDGEIILYTYPNPIVNSLNIDLDGQNNGDFEISITDMSGKILESSTLLGNSKNATVDFTNYTSGIYFLNVRNEISSVSRKIIKK